MHVLKDTGSRRRGIAAAGLAAIALAVPAASQAATPKLTGTVGPGYTITLKTAAGKKATSLRAGTYRIVISDRSAEHNFQLRGPGLNKEFTGVGFVGTKTVTVRLRGGKYGFVCLPHAAAMKGGFSVR